MNIDVTNGIDFVMVYLPSGLVPLHRSADAHELADTFRRAAQHLEECERREAERLDKRAARAVNKFFRGSGPVGTVSPASTVQLTHVAGTSCDCSCAAHCQVCSPDSGSAA